VVVWLTEDGRRITTIVKGATQPRSPFLGQYDLGYTCELLYYNRESGGIHQIRECTPCASRAYLRVNWAAMACASYFCHLASQTSLVDNPVPETYALLDGNLESLAHAQNVELVLGFEMALLHHLGLAPRLDRCLGCGRQDVLSGIPLVFHAARGGLLCGACRTTAPGDHPTPALPIDGAVLGFLQHAASLPPPHTGRRLSLIDEFRTSRLLGLFLQYHIDLPPECRDTVLRLLRFRTLHPMPERRHV
jgi:DNA repair protein RecO